MLRTYSTNTPLPTLTFLLLLVLTLATGCGGEDEAVMMPDDDDMEEPMDPQPTFDNIDPDLPSFVSVEVEPTTPEGMKWEKVEALTDDFDTFDQSKWYKLLWNYQPPVQMRAENSGVEDGKLFIKATLDENDPPENRWFRTSRIHSRTKINYPMYTEASIKAAHISAYNTYWLNDGDISNRNEIDIIENNSNPSCRCQPNFPWQMNSQYFHVINDDTQRNKGNFDNRQLHPNNPLRGVPWNEAYHTFGVWWKDERNIQFYLNGEPAGSVVSARDFTRDLGMIFDLWTFDATWLGGLAIKDHLKDESVNTMRVDWVRTWQLVEE